MTKTLIIAEAGVNHNGDMNLARKLIDVAAEAGADIVKFQTFKASKLASKNAAKASYQKKTTSTEESQVDMLKRLELNEEQHDLLIAYCAQKNIQFLSTPFEEESISLLKSKGITIGKIPSGEVTNLPYLEAMAKAFPVIIMSTGMAGIDEVKQAVEILIAAGTDKRNLTVLHCNTEYPTPMKDVNLRAMLDIRDQLGVAVGYSDHTLGIEVPVAAVALGATVIEKHITLDCNMEGPDHRASLEPAALKEMVKAIRNIELAVSGSGKKQPSESEQKNLVIVRKSIISQTAIRKGEIFTETNLTVKRPGNGISPMKWKEVIGQKAKRDFEPDELIEL